jgi:hypothetical protein
LDLLLKEYSNVFSDGIGCVAEIKAKLTLKENATPKFVKGTIGDAHSLVSTFDNIPSFSSLESSHSTCGLIENGTGLALTNLGVAFSFSSEI